MSLVLSLRIPVSHAAGRFHEHPGLEKASSFCVFRSSLVVLTCLRACRWSDYALVRCCYTWRFNVYRPHPVSGDGSQSLQRAQFVHIETLHLRCLFYMALLSLQVQYAGASPRAERLRGKWCGQRARGKARWSSADVRFAPARGVTRGDQVKGRDRSLRCVVIAV